jgi:acyl-CoA thioesterase I
MKKITQTTVLFCLFLFTISCENTNPIVPVNKNPVIVTPTPESVPNTVLDPKDINYLALGDSYTIGESVCKTCKFPEQLNNKLLNFFTKNSFSLQVIARTGWTTTDLIRNINQTTLAPNYDLVTLLIGVNNRYQGVSFSVYEQEFPVLVNKAIELGKGSKSNVIVVSIPDYAFTPYGLKSYNPDNIISKEIDKYNAFAQKYCQDNDITYVDITPITRLGLINKDLVATDDLHPSELAYAKFVELILPKAKSALEN